MRHLILILILGSIFASCKNGNKKVKKNPKEMVLAIQPYDGMSLETLDTIEKLISLFYGFQVKVLEERKMDQLAFTDVRKPRYRADSMIRFQRNRIPKDVDIILGLTTQDISITKTNKDGSIKEPKGKYIDFGIFGLGYRPGNSAIVSIYRLKREPDKFLDRFCKIVLHEIGHNLGLKHCKNSNCLMTDAAESILTIDNAKMDLCKACKEQIKLE